MMLVIRREQMEVFQNTADATFAKKLGAYLRQTHADAVVHLPSDSFTVAQLPEATLHQMVLHGMARARQYGITWESTLSAFIVLMFVTAPNFDTYPPIHRILMEPEIAPDSRIDALWRRTSEHDWESVEQHYDAFAWHP